MSYDVLTVLGLRLDECDSVGWDAIVNFIRHLPMDSATSRALNPDVAAFATSAKQSYILADIFDIVNGFAHAFSAAHSKMGASQQKPKPYPRPGAQDNDEHIGKDPIPIKDFDSWYYGGE